ncbi:hypothetical protein G6F35_013937 [Rhizopus arrhizus]|nr:hypothetical protein G6F35_013937 [Rhizopus arrhizus]
MYGRGAHGKLTDSGDWRETIDLNTHRYMLEDTRLGLSFLVSAGRWAGVPTPVAQGLLSVASAITGRDLYAEGRTLEGLGLDALICVIGAGRMGEGITLSYLLAGRDVTLIDIKPRQPTEQSAHDARVLANLRRELATFSQLGLLDARQADAVMGRRAHRVRGRAGAAGCQARCLPVARGNLRAGRRHGIHHVHLPGHRTGRTGAAPRALPERALVESRRLDSVGGS